MKIFLILILFLLTSSFASINENYQILVKEDYDMVREDNKTSAISWPQNDGTFIESFNKWQCYSLHQVKFASIEVEDHGLKCVPSIEVGHKNFFQSFDIDTEANWDCDKVLNDWYELIRDQESICLFGAFVQFEPSNIYLWDLEKIKTGNGYWSRSEESELLQVENESESGSED